MVADVRAQIHSQRYVHPQNTHLNDSNEFKENRRNTEFDPVFLGKLIGLFYDENGSPTEYSEQLNRRMQQAENEKNLLDVEKHNYPPCNVEWDAVKGSRVWCTRKRY